MKALTGALGLIWAVANLLAAYLLVRGGYSAPTLAKEGFLAQALLLLGGLLLAVFAALLAWMSGRLLSGRTAAAGDVPGALT
ncbi:MAG TPA: hypothetical protein VF157_01660 [Chloroflexota bacterium]